MHDQMKQLIVRAGVALVAAFALWRFGVQVNESHVSQMLDMVVTAAFGWLVLRKPGDVSKEEVKEAEERASRIPRAPVWMLALALLPQLTACAGSAEQQTRTALDATLALVEPASKLAADQCGREKRALVALGDSAAFEATVERCAVIFDGFGRIADVAEAALQALDSGHVQQARDMYAQLVRLWRDLRGGS